MVTNKYTNTCINDCIKVSRLGCVLATARDTTTGQFHLFLLFDRNPRIYTRRSSGGSWEELQGDEEYDTIRWRVVEALQRRGASRYMGNPQINLN